MICPKCFKQIADGVQYCSYCKTRVVCAKCGAQIESGKSRCISCGKPYKSCWKIVLTVVLSTLLLSMLSIVTVLCLIVEDADSPAPAGEESKSEIQAPPYLQLSKDGKTLLKCTAFYLNHIDIPEGITTISEAAFNDSVSIRGVSLPASLEKIEGNAFRADDCSVGNSGGIGFVLR